MLFNTLILLPVWLVLAWRFAERCGVWRAVLLPLVAAAAMLILRRLCFAAASGWGSTVTAAFDLHRLDVLKQMGILVPAAGWRAADEAAISRAAVEDEVRSRSRAHNRAAAGLGEERVARWQERRLVRAFAEVCQTQPQPFQVQAFA